MSRITTLSSLRTAVQLLPLLDSCRFGRDKDLIYFLIGKQQAFVALGTWRARVASEMATEMGIVVHRSPAYIAYLMSTGAFHPIASSIFDKRSGALRALRENVSTAHRRIIVRNNLTHSALSGFVHLCGHKSIFLAHRVCHTIVKAYPLFVAK